MQTSVALPDCQSALPALDWTNFCGTAAAGDTKVTVALPGSTGKLTVDHGFGTPPCMSGAGSKSSLRIRPWQNA